MFTPKQKYKAWFFTKEYGTIRFRKKKRFSPLKTIINYHGKPYTPIIDNPSFIKGLNSYYIFDIHSKEQITIHRNNNDVNTTANDLLYAREVLVQLFKSLGKTKVVLNWIHLVFAVGFAILGGWIVGSYFPLGQIIASNGG